VPFCEMCLSARVEQPVKGRKAHWRHLSKLLAISVHLEKARRHESLEMFGYSLRDLTVVQLRKVHRQKLTFVLCHRCRRLRYDDPRGQ
jgi:hypothetical protein